MEEKPVMKWEDLAKQIKPIYFKLTPEGIKGAKQQLKEYYKK